MGCFFYFNTTKKAMIAVVSLVALTALTLALFTYQ